MDEKDLSKSIGPASFLPPNLDHRQRELCTRLDAFHAQYSLKAKPSDMFQGAIFAMQPEMRSNPDWLAQAANSLREIFYPFWGFASSAPDKRHSALKGFGAVRINDQLMGDLDRLWKLLNDLAHHGSAPQLLGKDSGWPNDFTLFTVADFQRLLKYFEQIMFRALDRQVDIHKAIDSILAMPPPT
jgi:hypothetical protein